MSIEFKDLPVSYRLSQGGIAFVFVALTFVRSAFQPNVPPVIQIAFGSVLGAIVAASFIISYYVIIRYPYLSLVETEDQDHFSRHFSAADGRLYKFLKFLGLLVTGVMVVSIVTSGAMDAKKLTVLIYMFVVFCFLIFFTFFYSPLKHPTVSTFIRSTLGFGILLVPFFLPAVFLGSLRCSNLLDEAENALEE